MKARITPATERIVPSFEYLVSTNDIINPPKTGDIAICKDTGDRYIWDGLGWIPNKEKETNTLNTGLNLYDVNKQLVDSLPNYNEDDLKIGKSLIDEYVKEINSSYYMLLNKEIGYYTVFAIDKKCNEICSDEIMACIIELGDIKSISKTEDEQAIEIWIKQEDNISVMYLFDYAGGVIQCQL